MILVPSIKTLTEKLNVDRETAKKMRGLMYRSGHERVFKRARQRRDKSIDPVKFSDVKDWLHQCYHRPAEIELIMCALNQVLDGYGVEGLQIEGHWTDNYWMDYVGSYVNLGDTYVPTIFYLADEKYWKKGFKVKSWGEVAEKYLL